VRFSVITIIANLDKYRKYNFDKCVTQWLNQDFDDYEFICVEMSYKKDFYIHGNYNYYSVIGDEFKRGWLLNVGAKKSKGDILVFADSDILVRKDYLTKVDNWFKIGMKSAIGLNQLIRLNQDGSIKTSCIASIKGAAGGINIFDSHFFFKLFGGWNETFTFGDGNDNDGMFRAEAAGGHVKIFPSPVIHLWHPGKKHGIKNMELWLYTQRYPEIVTEKILELGIGKDKPTVYNIEELKRLTK